MPPPARASAPASALPPAAPRSHFLRVFLTGLLAALPLAATVLVFVWAIRLLLTWIGPQSAFGQALVRLGLGLSGSELVGYLLGLGLLLGSVYLLGLLVEAGLEKGLQRLLDRLIQRIPLVRSVYDLSRRMVALFNRPAEDDGLGAMRPVWCHFGGPGGSMALALLGHGEPVEVAGRRYLAVLIPTSPVPVGGGLIYVPEEWVSPAEVGIEGLTSIYVSMGLTTAEHLSRPAHAAVPGGVSQPGRGAG